ncbi:GNAT family N-acetyltransferase [Aromatoleum sp.]|uniref:GNAT family N-acetyltransferase n=1 Tax=Aromatoleum sp. TaxID=2307007 RepID=UPI002FCC356E
MALQRIARNFTQLGWIEAIHYFVARTVSRISGRRVRIVRYHLVAQPVPIDAAAACRPSAKNPVEFADADAPIVAEFPRPPAVIAKRFADGGQCLVARAGERFAGFLWLARGHYDEDMVRCRYALAVPEASAWDYDVYVAPEFRVGRTFARLWDTANEHLRADGVLWSFSRIESVNPQSLNAHRRLGVRKLFSVTFVRVGPLQLTVAGIAPYLHLSLSERSRPTLHLKPPRGGMPTKSVATMK